VAVAAGEEEMLAGGIVAVGDVCNAADTPAAETKRAAPLSEFH